LEQKSILRRDWGLETKSFTEKHLEAREIMKNYYIKYNPAPYLINITEI